MEMHIRFFTMAMGALLTLFSMQSCNSSTDKSSERGEPQLVVVEGPQYDKDSQSFSLALRVDSADDATVTYFLYDGDSLLVQNADGRFTGIAPLEEGYNVQAKVEWSDTTMLTPLLKVMGFIYKEPIEKLSVQQIQGLINKRNKETLEKHMAQQVQLTILDSKIKPLLIHDVLLQLENKVWDSVTVSDVEYDENNFIVAITLKPVEHVEPISEDDEEIIVDEY